MTLPPPLDWQADGIGPGLDVPPARRVTRDNWRLYPKKGEQLVLFTTNKTAKFTELSAWGKANGIAELMIPRDIRPLDALPVLGTGKLDYVTMGAMVG